MKVNRLDHINIQTVKLGETVSFYAEVLRPNTTQQPVVRDLHRDGASLYVVGNFSRVLSGNPGALVDLNDPDQRPLEFETRTRAVVYVG